MNDEAEVIKMPKRDFFALPATMRRFDGGLKVWATRCGRCAFVPVKLIN